MSLGIIRDVSKRCLLMCGQEATALGLPKEAGYCMHNGIVQAETEGWSDEVYLLWTTELVERFGYENEETLLELYTTCTDTMERYGDLFNALDV